MKNKLINALAAVLLITTIVNASLPTFAYDLNENRNSIESVEYQESANEDFTSATNVFAELKSEYKITIPKTIVLSGAKKAANYFVKVVGDIAGYEAIKVVPDKNFDLHTKNKDPYTAKVEQDRTIWYVDDLGTDGNGLVSADNLSAGIWQGVFYFNIDFVNALEEKILDNVIIPDYLDGDYRLLLSKLSVPGIYNEKAQLLASYDEVKNQGFDVEKDNKSAANVINSKYPETSFVVLPGTVTTIGTSAFENTNVKYVYIPNSVTNIKTKAFANSKIVSANIPSNATMENSAFDNTPATSKKDNVYYGNAILRVIDIDLENNDEAIIELERGYRYQILALYDFKNDVTKQSTIKVSDESVIRFVPEYYIDALEDGEAVISGKYITKSGIQKDASIKVRVKHTHVRGETVIENYIDSTCLEKGSYDEVVYCVLCNKQISKNTKNIALKSHTYDSGIITTPAQCLKNGIKTYTCVICGATKNEDIAKYGSHNYNSGKITTQPKCLTTGIKTYTCTRCGNTKTETVAELGHNFVNDICKRCGREKIYNAGLYDLNWNTVATWDRFEDLGVDLTKDYTDDWYKNALTTGTVSHCVYKITKEKYHNQKYCLVLPATEKLGKCIIFNTFFDTVIIPEGVKVIKGGFNTKGRTLKLPSTLVRWDDYWSEQRWDRVEYCGVVYTYNDKVNNMDKLNDLLIEKGIRKQKFWISKYQ